MQYFLTEGFANLFTDDSFFQTVLSFVSHLPNPEFLPYYDWDLLKNLIPNIHSITRIPFYKEILNLTAKSSMANLKRWKHFSLEQNVELTHQMFSVAKRLKSFCNFHQVDESVSPQVILEQILDIAERSFCFINAPEERYSVMPFVEKLIHLPSSLFKKVLTKGIPNPLSGNNDISRVLDHLLSLPYPFSEIAYDILLKHQIKKVKHLESSLSFPILRKIVWLALNLFSESPQNDLNEEFNCAIEVVLSRTISYRGTWDHITYSDAGDFLDQNSSLWINEPDWKNLVKRKPNPFLNTFKDVCFSHKSNLKIVYYCKFQYLLIFPSLLFSFFPYPF